MPTTKFHVPDLAYCKHAHERHFRGNSGADGHGIMEIVYMRRKRVPELEAFFVKVCTCNLVSVGGGGQLPPLTLLLCQCLQSTNRGSRIMNTACTSTILWGQCAQYCVLAHRRCRLTTLAVHDSKLEQQLLVCTCASGVKRCPTSCMHSLEVWNVHLPSLTTCTTIMDIANEAHKQLQKWIHSVRQHTTTNLSCTW